MFRYTPPLDPAVLTHKGEFDFTSEKGRSNIVQTLEISGILLLLCTPTFASGIGHLFGAVMATRQLLRRPSDISLGSLPVLHAMAASVVLSSVFSTDLDVRLVSGFVLGLESTALLYIGLTKNDPLSAWLDRSAPDTVRSRDTMGILGLGYLVASVLLLFANADTWTFRFMVIALICLGLGINGFGSSGASWQRAIGIYGGIVAMIGLSFSIEGENAGFWRSVIFLIIGMIAFGFGTLYLQRQGGSANVMAEQGTTMQMVQGGATYGQAAPASPAASPEPLPKPVMSDEDLEAITVDSDAPEPEPAVEASEDPAAASVDAAPAVEEPPDPVATVVDDMMDLLIDDAMRVRLHDAIRTTPHEGFRPTLKITENGEVLLEFLPL